MRHRSSIPFNAFQPLYGGVEDNSADIKALIKAINKGSKRISKSIDRLVRTQQKTDIPDLSVEAPHLV